MVDKNIILPKGFTLTKEEPKEKIVLPEGFTLTEDEVKKKEPTPSPAVAGELPSEEFETLAPITEYAQEIPGTTAVAPPIVDIKIPTPLKKFLEEKKTETDKKLSEYKGKLYRRKGESIEAANTRISKINTNIAFLQRKADISKNITEENIEATEEGRRLLKEFGEKEIAEPIPLAPMPVPGVTPAKIATTRVAPVIEEEIEAIKPTELETPETIKKFFESKPFVSTEVLPTVIEEKLPEKISLKLPSGKTISLPKPTIEIEEKERVILKPDVEYAWEETQDKYESTADDINLEITYREVLDEQIEAMPRDETGKLDASQLNQDDLDIIEKYKETTGKIGGLIEQEKSLRGEYEKGFADKRQRDEGRLKKRVEEMSKWSIFSDNFLTGLASIPEGLSGYGKYLFGENEVSYWLDHTASMTADSSVRERVQAVSSYLGEFDIEDMTNPIWWAKNGGLISGSQVPFLLLGGGAGIGFRALATALRLGQTGTMFLTGLGASAVMTPVEAMVNAGSIYENVLDELLKGTDLTEPTAEMIKKASEQTADAFKKDLIVSGMLNSLTFGIALGKPSRAFMNSLVEFGIQTTGEGAQEFYQEFLGVNALRVVNGQDPLDLKEFLATPEGKEAFTVGVIGGAVIPFIGWSGKKIAILNSKTHNEQYRERLLYSFALGGEGGEKLLKTYLDEELNKESITNVEVENIRKKTDAIRKNIGSAPENLDEDIKREIVLKNTQIEELKAQREDPKLSEIVKAKIDVRIKEAEENIGTLLEVQEGRQQGTEETLEQLQGKVQNQIKDVMAKSSEPLKPKVPKKEIPPVTEKPKVEKPLEVEEVAPEEEVAPVEEKVVPPEEEVAPPIKEVEIEVEQPITETTFKKELGEEFVEGVTIEKPITTTIETPERTLTYDYYTETTPEGEVKYLKKITGIEEKVIPERIPPEKVEVVPPEVPPKIPEEKLPPKEAIQRGFQKRSLEVASKTSSQKQVKAVVEENRDYYEQMNINDEINDATKEISNAGGFDADYENLRKKSTLPELSSRQIKRQLSMDHYGKLMNEAVKAKDEAKSKTYYDKINSLQEIASREATTAGQSSAMLMWWKFNRPDGTVDMIKRKIKTHNEKVLKTSKAKKLQEKIKTETDERKRRRLEAELQKLLAKELTPEQVSKLKKLAENVQKYKGKDLLEREAVTEMIRYMDSLYPTSDRFDTFVSLYYSSILSGASTHVLNMWSAGSNIVSLPIRNVTNLSLWYRAIKEGFKAGEWETFKAYNPMNEILYMPSAFAHGVSKGGTAFKNVWSEGGMDNKFMERVGERKYEKISSLERQTYGKNAFKRFRIAGIDVNPYNYAKYVGRALAAEDALMFNTVYDMQLASLLHEKYVSEGLRGKQLNKAVFDDLLARNVDKETIIKEVDKEIEEFEKDTGIKIDKTKRKILITERIQDRLDKELKVEAEELARDNIFTGDRGGLIANTARAIANIANKNFGTAIAIKPFIPFTRVVGNVGEFMMDTTPLYGIARAHGFSLTGLIKRTGADIRTAQLGEVGTRKYYEQMGRTLFGTTAFLVSAALFVGTDEDDFLEISGGYDPEGFRKRGREKVMPKYSIRIGNIIIPYMYIPTIAIPLVMIGNYNDRLKLGDKEEELFDRLTSVGLLSLGIIKDMTFMEGGQRLLEFMSDALKETEETSKEKIRKEEGIEKKVYRMMNESKVFKGLFKTYFGVVTRISPQNFNLIQQGQKLFDPTSYSQKDIGDMLKYNIGILRTELMFPNIDALGDPIKTYPGETLLPYTHWLGLKGRDERWKFLAKYNAIPTGIYNRQMYIDEEYRRLTPEELYKYTKLAGQNFNEKLLDYMEDTSEVISREKKEIEIRGKIITGIQVDIKDRWTEAKKEAKVELGLIKEIVPAKGRGRKRRGRRR